MASVIISMKIMPESPEIDLEAIYTASEKLIRAFTEDAEGEMKKEIEPVAFGLSALKITFVSDESKGSTDDVEAKIKELDGVSSVEIIDVRRAIG